MGWINGEDFTLKNVEGDTGSVGTSTDVSASSTKTDNDLQNSGTGNFDEDIILLTINDTDKISDVKKDITQEELNKLNNRLKTPINPVDPIVWHDPVFDMQYIITKLRDEITESGFTGQQADQKINGVFFPLIKINQRIIANEDILYMDLYSSYHNMLPHLVLHIIDKNEAITKLNSSGVDAIITVVIMAPINGVSKKIKATFHVIKVESDKTTGTPILEYYAEYRIPALLQKPTKAMGMDVGSKTQWPGCSICKSQANAKPNNWEMLHYIAKHCRLGFASTEYCQHTTERRYRNFYNYNSYLEVLEKELQWACVDSNVIFDWWVDFYGYIVMVNIPYILGETIEANQLASYGIVGTPTTADVLGTDGPRAVLVNRTLTNSNKTISAPLKHNFIIKAYHILTNNKIYSSGTLNSVHTFTPRTAGGTNGVTQVDVQAIENSNANKQVQDYTITSALLSIDATGDGLGTKKMIHEMYFEKIRAKQLVIELETVNLALQRGMLVNVVLTDNNPVTKSVEANNLANAYTDSDGMIQQTPAEANVKGDIDQDDPEKGNMPDTVTSTTAELPIMALNGLYYIDAVHFVYDVDYSYQHITQLLWLVKKGEWINYLTPKTPINVNIN